MPGADQRLLLAAGDRRERKGLADDLADVFAARRLLLLGVLGPDLIDVAVEIMDIRALVAEPGIKAKLTDLGGEPLIGTPEAFGAMIAAETDKWKKVIEEAKVEKVQ